MKTFNVRHSETFLWDMIDITLYILEESCDPDVPRKFYNDALAVIEDRAFGADSYEPYYPYDGSPEYRRIYFGNYTIFYVVDGDDMDVRRILWSGVDNSEKL